MTSSTSPQIKHTKGTARKIEAYAYINPRTWKTKAGGTVRNSGPAWATKPALAQAVLKKTTRNRDIVVHVVTPAPERKRSRVRGQPGVHTKSPASNAKVGWCGGLNENSPHRIIDLNT